MSLFGHRHQIEEQGTNNADSIEANEALAYKKALSQSVAMIEFSPDGTILDANNNFLNTLGYSLSEIVGQHHRMFVDQDERSSTKYHSFWSTLKKGEFFAGEFKRVTKDGNEIWIQASYNPVIVDGRVQKVIKQAVDITASKNESIITNGQVQAVGRSQAVIQFNTNGEIITANENFLAATGYTLNEVVGRHHRIFCDSEYANSSDYKEFWRALGNGENRNGQFRRVRKNGDEIWIQATYLSVLDDSGQPIQVVKYAQDITDLIKKQTEATVLGNSLADSVQEMSSAIDEVTKNIQKTATETDRAMNLATNTSSNAGALQESGKTIGQIIEAIQGLASQTKLLALNATIEAARAGESGKGFAVVAQEVKDLANQTDSATREIETNVSGIMESIDKLVYSASEIGDSISDVNANTTNIAAAIEQQSVTMASMGQTSTKLKEISN